MYIPISAWFGAFVLTVAVETPVVWYLLRRQRSDLLRLSLLIVFANLATHPAVWFVFTQLFLVGTTEYVVAAESWAVAAEAAFYWAAVRGLTVHRAIAVALLANLASFVAGRLVTELWPELFW